MPKSGGRESYRHSFRRTRAPKENKNWMPRLDNSLRDVYFRAKFFLGRDVMGLFGAGALRRKLEAKTTEFDGVVAELSDLQSKFKKLEEQLASKDEQFRIAREGRQKADKKVEKLTQKCATHDHKLSDLTKSLEKASTARDEYRSEMARLSSELERTRASIAQTGAPVAPEAPSITQENREKARGISRARCHSAVRRTKARKTSSSYSKRSRDGKDHER